MRNAPRRFRQAACFVILTAASAPPAMSQTIPADAKPTCTVPPATFKTWFESGSPTLNGIVNPANGLTFPNVPNCSFYQWSEQMFLWVTSPAPKIYGGDGRVFDSHAFFDVSPPDSSGKRTFIPHSPGLIRNFAVRTAQVGPNGLPVVMSKSGQLLEVITPPTGATGQPLIRNKDGAFVEIGKTTLDAAKKPTFFDKSGALIERHIVAQPEFRLEDPTARKLSTVRKFIIGGLPVFIDPFGNVVEVEEGQAGGDDVLQAQNGSLVYYVTIVNDVFAYMRTGAVDGGISPAPAAFPTTPAELTKITAFASAHGVTFPDPDALAVEMKTSWVEATDIANLSSYITMKAKIPTFDKSNPKKWVPNGEKTATLALVGAHIVGSVNGHPEMIWATFEHVANTPLATYQYQNASNVTKTVAQSTAGSWLFSASNSAGPFNVSHVKFTTPDIVAKGAFNIGPSDTLRVEPFGKDGTDVASNTEIISINDSVRSQLIAGDIRANYVFSGATWTIFGAFPTPGNQVGTNKLVNSTMETYQVGSNCFDCHDTNTVSTSHVYPVLKPLF
jgi:hypothetical protein